MERVTAQKLDGTATAAAIKDELKGRVAALRERGVVPGLGTVLVGDDPGSKWYVGAKHKDCAEIGIESIRVDLPATASQAEVEERIDELNAREDCTGFLVQQPTGPSTSSRCSSRVDPDKDVDGLHPVNLGKLVLGRERPAAVHAGRHPRAAAPPRRTDRRCRRGRGRARHHRGPPARPAADAQVGERHGDPVPHRHPDLAAHVRDADIVVAAAGVPGIITADMVKPGAAVLDVGVSRVDGKIAGDVHRGRVGDRRLGVAEPRRGGSDDPRHAAGQRGLDRREPAGLTAWPTTATRRRGRPPSPSR